MLHELRGVHVRMPEQTKFRGQFVDPAHGVKHCEQRGKAKIYLPSPKGRVTAPKLLSYHPDSFL